MGGMGGDVYEVGRSGKVIKQERKSLVKGYSVIVLVASGVGLPCLNEAGPLVGGMGG